MATVVESVPVVAPVADADQKPVERREREDLTLLPIDESMLILVRKTLCNAVHGLDRASPGQPLQPPSSVYCVHSGR